jgi:hypothetical protein
MNLVSCPGLFANPGFGSPEKSVEAFESGFAREIAGDKFLEFLFDDSIDRRLSLEGELTGLFQEIIINF